MTTREEFRPLPGGDKGGCSEEGLVSLRAVQSEGFAPYPGMTAPAYLWPCPGCSK